MRVLTAVFAMVLAGAAAAARDVQIYFIDVEGGQATLIVGPSGESMLVDAGWPGNGGRDATRIAEAAKLAGVKQIDYLLMTHYHLDHVGGIPEAAAKLPVKTYIDHGPDTETDSQAKKLSDAYEKTIAGAKHIVVKPGDRILLAGVDVEVLAAGGQGITAPVKGAGAANPACAGVKEQGPDATENARSVGFILTYGKFRFADFGDLTWNKELALVCPKNLIGTADLYLVSHHGMNISNSPAFVNALHPKVAVMNNGARKGGSAEAWAVVRKSPGLEDLWQLHLAAGGARESNSEEQLIANPGAADQGHWIKADARADGTFTVTNGRNGFAKTYR